MLKFVSTIDKKDIMTFSSMIEVLVHASILNIALQFHFQLEQAQGFGLVLPNSFLRESVGDWKRYYGVLLPLSHTISV